MAPSALPVRTQELPPSGERRRAAPRLQVVYRSTAPSRPDGVIAFLDERARQYGAREALALRDGDGWRAWSYDELRERSASLSAYLVERGLEPGARLVILSESRPEWSVAFFAAVCAGGVALPLDCLLTARELTPILDDARPRVLFTSRAELEKAEALAQSASEPVELVLLDDDGEPGRAPSYRELRAHGPRPRARERRWEEACVLTYTSGTTGAPKGVMTSFASLLHQARTLHGLLDEEREESLVSILPLHHLLELVGGLLTPLYAGSRVAYAGSLLPLDVMAALKARGATRMIVVPLFLQLVRKQIFRSLEASPARARAFALMFFFAALLPWRPLRRLLFARVHRAFGGRLSCFICGGAPLDEDTERFFTRLGVDVYAGYGLTETSPVISVNVPGARRRGSVGRPLPGVEVRIASDGEILTRGPHLMLGYWGRPDETRAVIDADGFFHTGDLGEIDDDTFLRITGRKKSLIVLPSGKKVSPEEVEGALLDLDLVDELCVLGARTAAGSPRGEAVCCLAVPSARARAVHGEGDALRLAVGDEIRRRVAVLAPHKRPTALALTLRPLPRTSTRKVKRAQARALFEALQEDRS